MIARPGTVFDAAWLTWLASWLAAAVWANRTVKRATTWETVIYRIAIVAGTVLFTPWAAHRLAVPPLWDVGFAGAYALAGVTIAGLLFTWWARIHLGRLWSGSITRKENHRVIDTGPYALVRHPIYSGLIVALVATALTAATPTALVAAAILVFGFWLKARAEERFLTAELGADAYAAYRRRVPMLMPLPGIGNQRSGNRDRKSSEP
jgi:protein-S-isoprenylcysteine O-methyltransferase Ste14